MKKVENQCFNVSVVTITCERIQSISAMAYAYLTPRVGKYKLEIWAYDCKKY